MEQRHDKQEGQYEEAGEVQKKVSPSAVRIMVILYILWVVKNVFSGVLRNETEGASPMLLAAAGAVLLIGALGLGYLEWKNYRANKKRIKTSGEPEIPGQTGISRKTECSGQNQE